MKNGFVCQWNFGHKIWGAVSVMMEGVYRGRPIIRVSNPIFGFFSLLRGALSA